MENETEANKKTYKPGNETYEITYSSPLLRPGVQIKTQVSGRYLVKTMHYMMQEARKFNKEQEGQGELEKKLKNG